MENDNSLSNEDWNLDLLKWNFLSLYTEVYCIQGHRKINKRNTKKWNVFGISLA